MSLTSAQRGALESLASYFPTAGQEDLLACLRAHGFNLAGAKAQYEREHKSRGLSSNIVAGSASYVGQQHQSGFTGAPGSVAQRKGALQSTESQDTPDTMKSAAQQPTQVAEARIAWMTDGGVTFHVFSFCALAMNWCEPFLIGFGVSIDIQMYIIFVNIGLHLIGIYKTTMFLEGNGAFPAKLWIALDAEVQFEAFFLVYGLISALLFPQYAALRCYRCISVMWYVERFQGEKEESYSPENQFFGIMAACKLFLMYIRAVAVELLSAKSKGAVVVLLCFYFICFITAAVANTVGPNVMPSNGDPWCYDLSHCFFTVMRLSFFDERGFDFLTQTWDDDLKFLFCILICHMCFTALILLNGLIGIVASVFNDVHGGTERFDTDATKSGAGGLFHMHSSNLKETVDAQATHMTRLTDEVRKLAANNRAVEKLLRDQRELLEDDWRERERHRR